jgi:hypothetical protein
LSTEEHFDSNKVVTDLYNKFPNIRTLTLAGRQGLFHTRSYTLPPEAMNHLNLFSYSGGTIVLNDLALNRPGSASAVTCQLISFTVVFHNPVPFQRPILFQLLYHDMVGKPVKFLTDQNTLQTNSSKLSFYVLQHLIEIIVSGNLSIKHFNQIIWTNWIRIYLVTDTVVFDETLRFNPSIQYWQINVRIGSISCNQFLSQHYTCKNPFLRTDRVYLSNKS